MTIKQQGGIFGRNPTFNDVTIENDLTVTDDITGQSVTAETATITDTSSSFVDLYLTGSTSSTCRILMGDTDSGVVGQIRYSNSAESMEFRTGNSTAATFNSSGNLAFPSGQGIDFSATSDASGSTSELFNDYEEGTFSPTLTTSGTDFDSVTYDAITGGRYIKVGSLVHFNFAIRTDAITVGSASGTLKIGGLPYTAYPDTVGQNGKTGIAISRCEAFVGEEPIGGYVVDGTTTIQLMYRSAVDGATSNSEIADAGTGGNDNLMYASGTYTTS